MLTTMWTYDGNCHRRTENGVVSTFDAQDRLLTAGAAVYEWDALGGRLSKTEGSAVTRYVHDGLGALTSVTLSDSTVVAYEYDGRQRRVAKRGNGAVAKRWVYDGQYRVVAEVDGAGIGPHGLPVGDGSGGESVIPPQQRKIIAMRA